MLQQANNGGRNKNEHEKNYEKCTYWLPGEAGLPGQTRYLQGKSCRARGVLGVHKLKDQETPGPLCRVDKLNQSVMRQVNGSPEPVPLRLLLAFVMGFAAALGSGVTFIRFAPGRRTTGDAPPSPTPTQRRLPLPQRQ